jgi:hypothetical protein
MTKLGKIRLGFAIVVGAYIIFKKLSDNEMEIERLHNEIDKRYEEQRKRFNRDIMNYYDMEDIQRILRCGKVVDMLGEAGDLSYDDIKRLEKFVNCDLHTIWNDVNNVKPYPPKWTYNRYF